MIKIGNKGRTWRVRLGRWWDIDWRLPFTVTPVATAAEEKAWSPAARAISTYPPRCPKCGEIVGKCNHYLWSSSP